jgi:hypothetical protein
MRIAQKFRMTTLPSANGRAAIVNSSPVDLTVRVSDFDATTGKPKQATHAHPLGAEVTSPTSWYKNQANLYSERKTLTKRLHWIPKTGQTSEGEIVYGHLRDPCDVVRNGGSSASDSDGSIAQQWDGSPDLIENLEAGCSWPVTQSRTINLPLSGKWSKTDLTRDIASWSAYDDAGNKRYELGSEQEIIPFLQDGLGVVLAQGMSKVGGTGPWTLDDFGHFELEIVEDLRGPNTTTTYVPFSTQPTSVVIDTKKVTKGQDTPLRVDDCGVLSETDLFHLVCQGSTVSRASTGKHFSRGKFDVLNPFQGVSAPNAGFQRVVQVDPDRTGWPEIMIVSNQPMVDYEDVCVSEVSREVDSFVYRVWSIGSAPRVTFEPESMWNEGDLVVSARPNVHFDESSLVDDLDSLSV